MITKLDEINIRCNKLVNIIEKLQLMFNIEKDITKLRRLNARMKYLKKKLDKKRIMYRELKAICIEIGIDL